MSDLCPGRCLWPVPCPNLQQWRVGPGDSRRLQVLQNAALSLKALCFEVVLAEAPWTFWKQGKSKDLKGQEGFLNFH